MKNFLLHYKKLHIWLLSALGVLLVLRLCRGNRAWMNALADHVTIPLRRGLGELCYRVDFSVMEVLYVLAALLALAYLVWSAAAVVRARGRRVRRAYGAALGAVCALVTVYTLFFFLWGLSFWTDSFQDKSGIYAQPVAPEDLKAVTACFAEQTARSAGGVPRDENGVFSLSWQEILADSPHVYDALEEEFPFLAFEDRGVKPMFFSRLMSRMDFTGFYCAYTGESNVNIDSPACLLPSTVTHELAHQRGVASEQECNFLAVLAATTSGNPAYVYSGWLMGYIYLGNALYTLDPEAYWAIRETLPETVRADLADNNAYWAQFQNSAAKKVSNKVYDSMLKAYGETRGIQSYGTVVDLLVAYYK
nr:DUF3810 domain-containing protein [uncultured Oscillibacter sp.]